jgi:hypothetical protein
VNNMGFILPEPLWGLPTVDIDPDEWVDDED